jgi:hypothetical protein
LGKEDKEATRVAGAIFELRSKHKIEGKEELPKEKLS